MNKSKQFNISFIIISYTDRNVEELRSNRKRKKFNLKIYKNIRKRKNLSSKSTFIKKNKVVHRRRRLKLNQLKFNKNKEFKRKLRLIQCQVLPK